MYLSALLHHVTFMIISLYSTFTIPCKRCVHNTVKIACDPQKCAPFVRATLAPPVFRNTIIKGGNFMSDHYAFTNGSKPCFRMRPRLILSGGGGIATERNPKFWSIRKPIQSWHFFQWSAECIPTFQPCEFLLRSEPRAISVHDRWDIRTNITTVRTYPPPNSDNVDQPAVTRMFSSAVDTGVVHTSIAMLTLVTNIIRRLVAGSIASNVLILDHCNSYTFYLIQINLSECPLQFSSKHNTDCT